MSDPNREDALFQAAAQLTGMERTAFLDRVCCADPHLRKRLQTLFSCIEENQATVAQKEGLSGLEIQEDLTKLASTLHEVQPAEGPGAVIGRYTLLEQIGEGGCGIVYLAEQSEPVKRRVALKVIKLGMDTRQVIARFEAERQTLALMDHQNIAKVLDGGTTQAGRPFFVMELVKGIAITRFCDERRFDTTQRLELFMLVCQAIQHAHQKGIIHRDIKPSNILVADHDGTPLPKVIDFGIAKATAGQSLTDKTLFTAVGQFIGTPAYMSPEQAEMSGLDIDTRSDIYSLGVLLYELLIGKIPFDPKRLGQAGLDGICRIIRHEEPPRPSTRLSSLDASEQTTLAWQRQTEPVHWSHRVRGDLDWIVMKCLEKDRNRRYETANGLAADIKRHLTNDPVAARPPSKVYRVQKAWRRNRLAFSAAAAVIMALMVGIGISTWQAIMAGRARDAEKRQRFAAQTERDKAQAAQTEAQRQRAQAEGLIEFMLGDLRKKLEPVGRLEVLDSVGAKVLDYYTKQDAQGLDAAALGRRARAQHLIGEIADQRGNTEEALASFRSAAAATAQALARAPRDGQRVFDHAQSVYWVGYIAWRRDQYEVAEPSFLEYRKLAHRLTEIDPSNANWQLETAYAEQNLGVVHLNRGQAAAALANFESAAHVYERLIASRPDLAFEYADALGWIANAKLALGDFDGAIESLQARGVAIGRLADRNRKLQQESDNEYRLAGLYLDLGKLDLAKAAARLSIEQIQTLVALDGSNFFWLNMSCNHRLRTATILLALGERDAVRQLLENVSSDVDRLVGANSAARFENLSVFGNLLALKYPWSQANGQAGPVEAMKAYLADVSSMETAGKHLSVDQSRIVAIVELMAGDELARLGQTYQAHELWAAARTRLQPASASARFEELASLAWAESRLGRRSEAMALAERLRDSKFRHPAYAEILKPLQDPIRLSPAN